MILDAEQIRDRLEDRWSRLGFNELLPEERDFILVWWLEAEVSNERYISISRTPLGILQLMRWEHSTGSVPSALRTCFARH